jgi:UDP-N-acetylglucosamine--N-acetylmuramyl-(pentapeptide) pyrophosphoryl-undecaprenol N-acetylglucosamine transferase
MRIVVSGGGTAGHVSPVLATVDALRRRDNSLELLYIGQTGGVESGLARAAGLRFVGVLGGKYRRDASQAWWQRLVDLPTLLLNLRDLIAIAVGTLQCLWWLGRFRPAVIFNKVGPAGLPVGLAARLLAIPTVIHEPDITPGLANRTLSRWAATIAVGFPTEYYRRFPAHKLVFTGTPVQAMATAGERAAARSHFGFQPDRSLVLVTGGSQGAVALNSAVIGILPELLALTQIHHLTGSRDHQRVAAQTKEAPAGYRLDADLPVKEMQQALAAADVVVARAGANTIAELAILAKPTILVPNREAAAHQLANAAALEKAGAALVVDDTNPQALLEAVARVLSARSQQRRLSDHIAGFAHPDAASRLAELILAAAGGTTR